MKKIILVSLGYTVFLATISGQVNALDAQQAGQNFHQEKSSNLLLAQDRRYRDRQYSVYYRGPRDRRWTFEGFHPDRRDAERAARRLERRGFRVEVREGEEIDRRVRGDRDDRFRDDRFRDDRFHNR